MELRLWMLNLKERFMNKKIDYNIKLNTFNIIKMIFLSYNFFEKLSFIFNILQSVLSQVIFSILSWYVFDILFDRKGNEFLALFIILIAFIYFVFMIPLWGYFMEKGKSRFKEQFSNYIIERCFNTEPIRLSGIHTADILHLLQSDVEGISEIAGWSTVVFFQAIVSGIVAMICFLSINVYIMIMLIFVGIIPIVFDYFYTKKNTVLQDSLRTLNNEKRKNVINILDNYIILKIYNELYNQVEKLLTLHKRVKSENTKCDNHSNILSFVHNLIYKAVFKLIIIVVGLKFFANGELSIGSIAFMFSMSEGISFFMGYIGGYIRNIQEIVVSKKKIEKILNENIDGNLLLDDINFGIDDIKICALSFSYDENIKIFDKCSFNFNKGERYIIIGENGRGKSTLLKLIYGIYLPNYGKILVNGENIRLLGNENIAYIPQEPMIISDTIMQYFTDGKIDVSKEKVHQIMKELHLDNLIGRENIQNFRDSLSKGEMSRLVFAKAILHNPDLILIDEIDANIDEESLLAVSNAIDKYCTNAIVIAITHNYDYSIWKNYKKIVI